VQIIGFPYGLDLVKYMDYCPLWTTGWIASEPNFDIYYHRKYDESPAFFVDCRTRRGQSGSPVIIADTKYNHEPELIGIYGGRINKESDIGIVWKARAIKDLIDSL
jgi:hypothetical protein